MKTFFSFKIKKIQIYKFHFYKTSKNLLILILLYISWQAYSVSQFWSIIIVKYSLRLLKS